MSALQDSVVKELCEEYGLDLIDIGAGWGQSIPTKYYEIGVLTDRGEYMTAKLLKAADSSLDKYGHESVKWWLECDIERLIEQANEGHIRVNKDGFTHTTA